MVFCIIPNCILFLLNRMSSAKNNPLTHSIKSYTVFNFIYEKLIQYLEAKSNLCAQENPFDLF